jgi:hypothetical protein
MSPYTNTYNGVPHILCCGFILFFPSYYHATNMLPVALDCPFFIQKEVNRIRKSKKIRKSTKDKRQQDKQRSTKHTHTNNVYKT